MMRWLLGAISYSATALLSLWAAAALYYDLPFAGLRTVAAVLYSAVALAVLILVKPRVRGRLICVAGFSLALTWWLSLAPRNDRNWQPDVSRTAWADIDGNAVTVHNVRNFDYRTETDYTPHWEPRTFDMSKIQSGDIFITYWGSPWIAHPIISFEFTDGSHLAFSIETRKEIGEDYSAVKGFFRQYELIYIAADERDVVRLRTNYRKGEEVYLYRTNHPPARLRLLLMEYLKIMNLLHSQAVWYNALTTNCTTAIFKMAADAVGDDAPPFDWRLILNGRMDEMMYQRGALAGNLPLPELKLRAHINEAARAADQSPDFSRLIREGRPGF